MTTRQPGTVSMHPRGFGFVNLDDGTSAFVIPPDLNGFLLGDRVEADIVPSDGRLSASKLKLVERARGELFGDVVQRGGSAWLRVDRTVSNTDWPLVDSDVAVGAWVVAVIDGDVVRAVRSVDSHETATERVLVRHGVRTHFSPEALAEIGRAPALSLAGRRDLRDVVTVTIDGPSTRDLDDALAVLPRQPDGALRVLVSIADVDAVVVAGGPLDDEARARGTSTYLPGRVVPMLPTELCEDALSLLQGHDRRTLTVELRIDAEGRLTSTDVYASIIRNHARLTYDDVTAFLDDGDGSAIPPHVHDTVRLLRTAAARIGAARVERGGIEVAREEAHVVLDADTHEPTGVSAHLSTTAHVLVERLMVAANEAVARFLVERGLPGVYRVHDAPTPERVRELEAFSEHFGLAPGFGPTLSPRGLAAFEAQFKHTKMAPAVYAVLARVLGPARYTVEPGLHFGLGAPLYLHFTSPIRRYADLAVHRIVKAHLDGKRDLVANDPALATLSAHLNARARSSAKAENERTFALSARWFASKIGERYTGNVVAVKPLGLVVQLLGTGASGTVSVESLEGPTSGSSSSPPERVRVDVLGQQLQAGTRTFTPGDRIEVLVARTDEELGRIELVLAPAVTAA